MAKTFDDKVAEEVNKRLTLAASAAGVDRGRVEIEILFLLPPEFVRQYKELFDRALADPIKPTTDGGKDEGRVRASGRTGDGLHVRTMGAAGGGKRFVAGSWPIRDERAVELKRRLDRQIIGQVRDALALLSIGAAGVEEQPPPPQCTTCGLFQKPEWVRCPFHI